MVEVVPIPKRIEFWSLAVRYLRAVGKYWYAIIVGVVLGWVDLLERIFGTWWIFPTWVRLATTMIGLTVAQFLAYRDLHQEHLNVMGRRDAEQADIIEKLQAKIAELQVRPYDVAKKELVRTKLNGLDQIALDVVRFLLQHGEADRNTIERQMGIASSALDGAFGNLSERMLLTREERLNVGRASTTLYWRVNEEFRQILEDLLF